MFYNFYIPEVYAARNKLKFVKPVKSLVPNKLNDAYILYNQNNPNLKIISNQLNLGASSFRTPLRCMFCYSCAYTFEVSVPLVSFLQQLWNVL